jgi:hypothetical protein
MREAIASGAGGAGGAGRGRSTAVIKERCQEVEEIL